MRDRIFFVALLCCLASTPSWGADFDAKTARTIEPEAIVILDAQHRPIGDPIPYVPRSGQSKDATAFANAFDATLSLPTALPNLASFFSSVYGAAPTPSLNAEDYRARIYADDMNLNPSQVRRVACLATVAGLWNPDATVPASGTGDLMIVLDTYTSALMSPAGPANSGLITSVGAIYRNVAAGTFKTVIDLSQSSQGWGLPATGGGYQLSAYGVSGTGTPVQLGSQAFQLALSVMRSPGDPQFPGTNPSSSSAYAWVDDTDAAFGSSVNHPNYVLENLTNASYSELRSFDRTATANGVLHPAVGFFVDHNARMISGKVHFGSCTPGAEPAVVTIGIRRGVTIAFQNVLLGPNGEFEVRDVNPSSAGGASQIAIKVGTWLRKKLSFNSGAGSVNVGTISLINGDCNGDNAVDASDYFILSDAYETAAGDQAYLSHADLNRDGFVDASDYFILSDSYDLMGDSQL